MSKERRKKILVVDDDTVYLEMAKIAIAPEYSVDTVKSGEEALQYLCNRHPDMILMDIDMPGMDGRETVSAIKSDEKCNDIPIVFLSAYSDPKTEVQCLKLGADDFISKPFLPMVMNVRISRILELYELRKSLENQLEKKTKMVEQVTLISQSDPLTGLFNRTKFEEMVNEYIDNGIPGALFIIDMDDFKGINDQYGHIAGDKTLKLMADLLKKEGGESGFSCRLGGDEFMSFFPQIDTREKAGEKAGKLINTIPTTFEGLDYASKVSVSIGISFCPTDGDSFKKIYSCADKALYFTKNNGKDSFNFFFDRRTNPHRIDDSQDLETIRRMIEGSMDKSSGTYHVGYGEFQKIYNFVSRCVERKHQEVQTVLFSINCNLYEDNGLEQLEMAMGMLKDTVSESLRASDVGAQYSSSQYVLLLMDSDISNGRKVAGRVVEGFTRRIEGLNIELTYAICTMTPAVYSEQETDTPLVERQR